MLISAEKEEGGNELWRKAWEQSYRKFVMVARNLERSKAVLWLVSSHSQVQSNVRSRLTVIPPQGNHGLVVKKL